MYKVQQGTAPDIINDIFRKRNMRYNTKNIKTVHYGSETITYSGHKISPREIP